MKLSSVALALVLLSPLGASIAVPRVVPFADPALYDPSDAELMLRLARLEFPGLVPLPQPAVKPGDTLEAITLRLAERGGRADVAAVDLAELRALDARVAAPTLLLLTGVEAYWDAYDRATASLAPGEIEMLARMGAAGLDDTPEFRAAEGEITWEEIFAASIMLVDLTESVVVPALQDAVAAGAWPATATADPVGVFRLGGAGNDPAETLDRIVQIDPSGDDKYFNNAGGSTHLDPVQEGSWNIISPVGISIDFAGNDQYNSSRVADAIGSGDFLGGFGMLLDFRGNDVYFVKPGGRGIAHSFGILHDFQGNDRYRAGTGIAYGLPLAVLRDDLGNDLYDVRLSGGGFGAGTEIKGTGLLWDRDGTETYQSNGVAALTFGWGRNGGRGWLVDEGAADDWYGSAVEGDVEDRHGCDDCTWAAGDDVTAEPLPIAGMPPGGQGNDNRGGLAYLLAEQDAYFRMICDPSACV